MRRPPGAADAHGGTGQRVAEPFDRDVDLGERDAEQADRAPGGQQRPRPGAPGQDRDDDGGECFDQSWRRANGSPAGGAGRQDGERAAPARRYQQDPAAWAVALG